MLLVWAGHSLVTRFSLTLEQSLGIMPLSSALSIYCTCGSALADTITNEVSKWTYWHTERIFVCLKFLVYFSPSHNSPLYPVCVIFRRWCLKNRTKLKPKLKHTQTYRGQIFPQMSFTRCHDQGLNLQPRHLSQSDLLHGGYCLLLVNNNLLFCYSLYLKNIIILGIRIIYHETGVFLHAYDSILHFRWGTVSVRSTVPIYVSTYRHRYNSWKK